MEHLGRILSIELSKSGLLKSRGYTKVPNFFIEDHDFSTHEKMVAIVISKHQMNKKSAWPSQKRIAMQAGCSISTVKKAIKGLQVKKVIIKEKCEKGRNNKYLINLDIRRL